MKLSDFINKNDIPEFLLGAFFGRYEFSDDKKIIYTYSSYRNNTKIYDNPILCESSKDTYVEKLNKISFPYNYWKKRNKIPEIVFELENDLNLNEVSFFNKLNTKILQSDFIYDISLTERQKMFIRGFSELRGSIDRSRNLFAMDFKSRNQNEVKRIRLLIDHLNVPISSVNYNFREFQPDYQKGKKRETQVRFKLSWYATEIGFVNDYKIEVFKNTIKFLSINQDGLITYFVCPKKTNLKQKNTFEERLSYYHYNVFGKKLTKKDRAEFDKILKRTTDLGAFKRDPSIVKFVRDCTPDECACCCKTYNIEDRSFLTPYKKYYFEIHHMISLGNDRELDDVDNLVKLCPVCHTCLKQGRADPDVQMEYIKKILNHKNNVLDFCKSYFDEDKLQTLVVHIWESLK